MLLAINQLFTYLIITPLINSTEESRAGGFLSYSYGIINYPESKAIILNLSFYRRLLSKGKRNPLPMKSPGTGPPTLHYENCLNSILTNKMETAFNFLPNMEINTLSFSSLQWLGRGPASFAWLIQFLHLVGRGREAFRNDHRGFKNPSGISARNSFY